MNMIIRKINSVNGDGGKREKNLNFYTRSWPPLLLLHPTSIKNFSTFSLFGTYVILMLPIHLLS
jgi:hypothetical protein